MSLTAERAMSPEAWEAKAAEGYSKLSTEFGKEFADEWYDMAKSDYVANSTYGTTTNTGDTNMPEQDTGDAGETSQQNQPTPNEAALASFQNDLNLFGEMLGGMGMNMGSFGDLGFNMGDIFSNPGMGGGTGAPPAGGTGGMGGFGDAFMGSMGDMGGAFGDSFFTDMMGMFMGSLGDMPGMGGGTPPPTPPAGQQAAAHNYYNNYNYTPPPAPPPQNTGVGAFDYNDIQQHFYDMWPGIAPNTPAQHRGAMNDAMNWVGTQGASRGTSASAGQQGIAPGEWDQYNAQRMGRMRQLTPGANGQGSFGRGAQMPDYASNLPQSHGRLSMFR